MDSDSMKLIGSNGFGAASLLLGTNDFKDMREGTLKCGGHSNE